MSLFRRKKTKAKHEFAHVLVEYSVGAAGTIQEILINMNEERLSGDTWKQIVMEFIVFYLLLTERFAEQVLPDNSRFKLLGELIKRTVEKALDLHAKDDPAVDRQSVGTVYMQRLVARSLEYNEYEEWVSPDPYKPTLFLAFGRNVVATLGRDPDDAFTWSTQTYVVASLKEIDFPSALKNMT